MNKEALVDLQDVARLCLARTPASIEGWAADQFAAVTISWPESWRPLVVARGLKTPRAVARGRALAERVAAYLADPLVCGLMAGGYVPDDCA